MKNNKIYPLLLMTKMENNKQITEFKKVIESCHVNFLFGSGASQPFLETLNDLETNLTSIHDSTEPNVQKNVKLIEASIFVEYLNKCLFGNLFFNKKDKTSFVEKCIEKNPEKAEDFFDVQAEYEKFINNINGLLRNRDIQLLSKQINIFTTNVDVFLEESLEANQCTFNDGFNGRKELLFDTANFHNTTHKLSTHYEYTSEVPHINLFKLHGSLNWIKSMEKSISEYYIKADYSLKNLEELYEIATKGEKDFIDYKLISEGIRKNDYKFLSKITPKKDLLDNFFRLYNQLIMINPTKKKFEDTTRNVHYYEMLRMYANHLERENSVLFVLGFSFADEHIQQITQRVAKSNPTLIIYILCANQELDEFEKKFKSHANVKYIVEKDGYFTLNKLNLYLSEIGDSIPSNN